MAPGLPLPAYPLAREQDLHLAWKRSPTGTYYRLHDHRIALAPGTGGLFVIWHGGPAPHAVVLGQARDLSDRLSRLTKDPRIQQFEYSGGLFASWAFLCAQLRDGAERFLVDHMAPIIRNPPTCARPIPVNLP